MKHDWHCLSHIKSMLIICMKLFKVKIFIMNFFLPVCLKCVAVDICCVCTTHPQRLVMSQKGIVKVALLLGYSAPLSGGIAVYCSLSDDECNILHLTESNDSARHYDRPHCFMFSGVIFTWNYEYAGSYFCQVTEDWEFVVAELREKHLFCVVP